MQRQNLQVQALGETLGKRQRNIQSQSRLENRKEEMTGGEKHNGLKGNGRRLQSRPDKRSGQTAKAGIRPHQRHAAIRKEVNSARNHYDYANYTISIKRKGGESRWENTYSQRKEGQP